MSNKEWIYRPDFGCGLYQEISLDVINNNPPTIEIEHPENFSVGKEELNNGSSFTLRVEISAEQFDEIAVAWCKSRKLL